MVYVFLKWTDSRTHHIVLNSELEQIFDVTAGVIRKRANQIWTLIFEEQVSLPEKSEFTVRDEANAICAYVFRNGPIEDIHASVDSDGRPRITDPEMKQLMITASERLEELLQKMRETPDAYMSFVLKYNRNYCRAWVR
ncbi:MAG: hypothetical protein Tsb009_05260 [Planctomycetaceae bacterium]